MSKPSRTETLPDNLLDHRAVRAWAALKPVRVEPEGIEILKLRDKSAVYRLGGVGPDGSAVIAKRCRRPACLVERIIYERLFARQLVPALRWYGFLDEPDNVHSWLFLEDAGTGTYLPPCAEHRALAGRWLGTRAMTRARRRGSPIPTVGPRSAESNSLARRWRRNGLPGAERAAELPLPFAQSGKQREYFTEAVLVGRQIAAMALDRAREQDWREGRAGGDQ